MPNIHKTAEAYVSKAGHVWLLIKELIQLPCLTDPLTNVIIHNTKHIPRETFWARKKTSSLISMPILFCNIRGSTQR